MTPLQQLIAKYEKSIKRLDQKIMSSRAHPSRTNHIQSVMETYEEVVLDLRKLLQEQDEIGNRPEDLNPGFKNHPK